MLNIIRITSFIHSFRRCGEFRNGANMHLLVQIGKGKFYWLIYVFTKDRLKTPNTPNSK